MDSEMERILALFEGVKEDLTDMEMKDVDVARRLGCHAHRSVRTLGLSLARKTAARFLIRMLGRKPGDRDEPRSGA